MDIQLNNRQHACRDAARQFVEAELAPCASQIDRDDTTPPSVLAAVRAGGYLGAALPADWEAAEWIPSVMACSRRSSAGFPPPSEVF